MGEEKKGFFSRLKEGLTKTRNNIVHSIDAVFSGFSSIDEEFYEELEEILIMGDIGVKSTGEILDRLREQVRAAAVLAAGDSAFDLPMLTAADFAAAPAQCGWKGLPCHVQVMPGKKVFSEELLEAMQRYLLHIL